MRTIDIIMAKRFGKGKKGMAIGWPWMMGTAGGGGTETTVTGVSPLFLEAAIKAKIKSLTQYGLCTQADTPSGTNVPIVCNNGTLTMVDDELPIGYKRVLDIGFDGSAYYKTGEKLYGSDVVTMTLDNTTTTGQNVFGAYSGTASGNKNFSLYVYGGNSTSNSYLRYNETLYRPRYGSGQRTISFGAGGTDGFLTDVSFDEETFTSSATAYIGALPNSSSPKFTGTIVGNIMVGTRLKYVPCERVSDNAVGYYEVNSGVFLEPEAGTPTFSGYDASHLALSVVGTDEVISVSGKNLYNAATRVDGYYLSSGGVPTEADGSSYSAAIPIKYGQTITFSGISGKTGTNNKRIKWYTNDDEPSTSNVISSPDPIAVEGAGVPYSKTFSVWDNRAKFMRISINTADTNVMIEIGDTATDYAPYTEQTASAPDLFAVGDYADEVEIISGAITRNVGVLVFDGTEDWTRVALATGNQFTYSVSAPSAQSPTISTHFDNAPDGATIYTQPNNSCWCGNTGLRIRCDAFSTKEEWKAYLAAQYAAGTPVIVIYPLREPATEQTDPQPMSTVKGDNVLSWTAAVEGKTMDVTYMKESA